MDNKDYLFIMGHLHGICETQLKIVQLLLKGNKASCIALLDKIIKQINTLEEEWHVVEIEGGNN